MFESRFGGADAGDLVALRRYPASLTYKARTTILRVKSKAPWTRSIQGPSRWAPPAWGSVRQAHTSPARGAAEILPSPSGRGVRSTLCADAGEEEEKGEEGEKVARGMLYQPNGRIALRP